MSSEFESKMAARKWFSIFVLAGLSVVLGGILGFVSRALVPVKAYVTLPKPDPKDAGAGRLPEVYWLKQYTASGLASVGDASRKAKAVDSGLATALTDRELARLLGRALGGEAEVSEDLDAKPGRPFVRIGGRAPGAEHAPVLTVTMPFKLKIFNLPVSEVPLQFVATPAYDGGVTAWEISDAHLGHAAIPSGIARSVVGRAIAGVMDTTPEARRLWRRLGAYRRVFIRDNKLFLEDPEKLPDEPATPAATKPAKS